MITTETVFILGAGASMPYGFPSGEQLVDKSIEYLKGRLLERYEFNPTEIRVFESELTASRKRSVDAFLEHRPEFRTIGKTAIAYGLLERELFDSKVPVRDWYNWILD
jgi:hypothetical protein